MNKSIIYGLGIACLVIGLNSCVKTTKRKITNDWKIVSLEEERKGSSVVSTEEDYWKTDMTENTVYRYSHYTLLGVDGPYTYTYETTGEVKENKMSIKKDGTWQWTQELSYDWNGSENDTYKKDLSGTWSFVSKTKGDDFKKNERIIFNILLNKNSTIQTQNQQVVNDYNEEKTFLTGENTMTFTVKESKKKELQLEMESTSNYSNSWSSGVNYQSKTLKMTLKEQ